MQISKYVFIQTRQYLPNLGLNHSRLNFHIFEFEIEGITEYIAFV